MGEGIFFEIEQKGNSPEFRWKFCYRTHILQELDILTYGNWEFYPQELEDVLDYETLRETVLQPLRELYRDKIGTAELRDMHSGVDFVTRIGEFQGGNHVRFYLDKAGSLRMDICLVDDLDEKLCSDFPEHPSYLHYARNIPLGLEVLARMIEKIEKTFGSNA